MTKTTSCPSFPGVLYPVLTVIVFAGSPSSTSLVEHQRVYFESTPAGEKAARRFARGATSRARTNWQTGGTYVLPCASIFEDSPSKGLGNRVAEYTSRARASFLARVAAGAVALG